jgi:putative transposase
VAHGIFGQRFNKKFNRSGKVANERPKTPLVGGLEAEIRVHFYIEANPIRAGMTTAHKLRYLFWNSYRFYAHGIIDEWTKHLTPPQWYLDLGKTPAERQRAYRELFRKYLEQKLIDWTQFLSRFIGSPLWIREKQMGLKERLLARIPASARASPA